MTSGNCFSPLPDTTRTVRLCWIVGCILSGIGYGALLIVGCACYVGLRRRSSQSEGYPRATNILIIYVVVTLLLMTVVEIFEIIVTVNSVLDDACFSQNLQPPNPYLGGFAFPASLIIFTFIWRCYIACGGLRGQRGWATLLWVIPLIVYVIMICTGVITVVRLKAFNPSGLDFDVLVPIIYGTTGFLNVLITMSLTILIMRYQCVMAQALGGTRPLPYPNVLTVLVESAGLVVLFDVFGVMAYTLGAWWYIAGQVWIPMQPMASFLIIYRVSQGSDYFHRESECGTTSSLRFGQVSEVV